MPGVQRFIDQRQQAQPDSRRQASAHLHKVPVPATKLQYTERRPVASKPSNSLIANLPSTTQVPHQSGLQSVQTSTDHDDGFDTDAEGLDDTTVTSAGYDSKGHQGNEDSINHGSPLPCEATDEYRGDEQNFAQLGADDLTVDGDDESYEESGEGESDNQEEEGDGQYEDSILPNVMQELNSPGYARFRQQIMPFSNEAAFKQVMESPTLRNSGFTNFAMKNAGNQSSRPMNPSKPRGHCAGDNSEGSDADTQNQSQRGTPPGTKRMLPFISQQQSDGSVKRPSNPVPLSSLPRTVSVKSPFAQQPSAALFPPPLPQSQSQSHNAQVETKLDDGTVNGNILVRGEDNMMPPRMHPSDTGKTANLGKRFEAGMRPNINPEAMSGRNEFAGLGDDEFSAGEEQGLWSAASEEHGKTRKRGRSMDYSLDELAGMEFNQLSAEAFHLNPQDKEEVLPPQLAGRTLVEKLDYLVKLEDHNAKVSQQMSFLSSLPMEEYDECGDIMVERFSEFVKTFKNARQQRRKIAKEFEEEVAKREAWVRGKIDAFEKDLNRLKRGGEDVVRKRLAL